MKRNIIEQDDPFEMYINQDVLMTFTSGSEPLDSDPDPDPNPNPDYFGDSNLDQQNDTVLQNTELASPVFNVDPNPHISPQFFSFNKSSHELMVDCIVAGRVATADEIRGVCSAALLESWRNVWKDRSENIGFVTAWKRIQEKLNVRVDPVTGENLLFFKSKSSYSIAYIEQWFNIVMSCHSKGNFKHLGFRKTTNRVKKMWTVNAKCYGIPESFIRVCVNCCPICCDSSSGLARVSKRMKFEFTESFSLPVNEAEMRLQELAKEHKAVLCLKQKYFKYSPYVAEVKDYACRRAGEPTMNDSQDLKKKSHLSKKCGCRFRIRIILPVLVINENRTCVYQDDGVAVFQLDAVHSGHETGDIGGVLMDQDLGDGMRKAEEGSSGHVVTVSGNPKDSLMSHLKELKSKVELLEGKVENMPSDMLTSAAQAAFEALDKLRSLEEHVSNQHSDEVLAGRTELEDWGHDEMIPGNHKPAELIADDGNSFGGTLGNVAS